MEKEKIFKSICEFMDYAGEDFFEYFADEKINIESWAFFLLGKGYIEHANKIIDITYNHDFTTLGDPYIKYKYKYSVYPERVNGEYLEVNHDKNLMLMAEFISVVPYYTKIFINFDNDWRCES